MSATLPPPSAKPSVPLQFTEINRRGGDGGCPVIILHGLLGSSRNFKSWASALHERLQRPRRLLVPDLR
jgi:pimeloyl-ACP methyl ester carboxylesterase